MSHPIQPMPWQNDKLRPILNRLRDLYAEMDRRYAEAAEYYGFNCDGCTENCCLTRFYHFTIIEFLYLNIGVHHLSPGMKENILTAANGVVKDTHTAEQSGQIPRIMCPLNQDTRCILYSFRPMICRLHGVSHQLRRGDNTLLQGEGCRKFDVAAMGKIKLPFDRTPLYNAMALLEKDMRIQSGFTGKIKMTIAEMLTAEYLLKQIRV